MPLRVFPCAPIFTDTNHIRLFLRHQNPFGTTYRTCVFPVSYTHLAAGDLPTLESLKIPKALANFSFGQGALTATPVQIAGMVNACLLYTSLWDDRAFWFASEDNRAYGGRLVCTHGPADAICRYAGEGLCEVTELMCTTEHLPKLFGAMLQAMPASNYRIRLPKGSGLLEMAGLSSLSAPEPVFCGMLRPLDGASMDQLQVGEKKPYLGLGKD